MFVLFLYRYILGYVKFSAKEGFTERFLNLCALTKIHIWGTVCKQNKLTGYVLAKDYKRLRPAVRKSGVKLKILHRLGLSFIVYRYRARTGIVVGFIMFLGVLYFLSLFIWNVDVIGNTNISDNKIANALSELNLYEGRMRSQIDVEDVRQHLLLKMPELSWAAINIEGTYAEIDVRETVKPPEPAKGDIPCNLKAVRDGRITEMKVLQGNAMVKPGDSVVKGDLLVSGAIEHKNGVTIFKHASAEIKADTQRTLSVFSPYNQTVIKRTGKCNTRSVVTVLGVKVPLFLGSVKGTFEREQNVWQMRISGVKLPLSLATANFYETENIKIALNETGTREDAKKLLSQMEKTQLKDAKILSKQEKYTLSKTGITLTVNYLCNEKIEIEENILINK